jgi:hypothetical protein
METKAYARLEANIFQHLKNLLMSFPRVFARCFALYVSPDNVNNNGVHADAFHSTQCGLKSLHTANLGGIVAIVVDSAIFMLQQYIMACICM